MSLKVKKKKITAVMIMKCDNCYHKLICVHYSNIRNDTYARIGYEFSPCECENYVDTSGVAPVVHGYWENDEALSEECKTRCSRCKTEYEWENLNNMQLGYVVPYCPNCGAKMID